MVDLEANTIDRLDGVSWLAMCKRLRSLTLIGNPVVESSNYRIQTMSTLPALQILDDMPVDSMSKEAVLEVFHSLVFSPMLKTVLCVGSFSTATNILMYTCSQLVYKYTRLPEFQHLRRTRNSGRIQCLGLEMKTSLRYIQF